MKNYSKYLIVCLSGIIIFYIPLAQFISVPFLDVSISLILSIVLVAFFRKKIIASKNNSLLVVCIFLLVLFIPLVGEKETTTLENRALKEFPEWRWSNVWVFFKDFQGYFDDRFAYRNTFIDLYGKLIYNQLNFNPINDRVVIGKESWLFGCQKQYLRDISNPHTESELQKIHFNLVVITKWFEKHGIKYYLTIPPVKARIYAEMMPDYLQVRLQYSRLEQIHSYLSKKSDINIIDFRKELIASKSKHELYYKTDTHWNEHGSFIGYSKIIRTIKQDFPEIVPNKLANYNEERINYSKGDLLGMLGFDPKIIVPRYYFTPKDSILPILKHKTNEGNPQGGFEKWEMPNNTNNLKIFIIRDSFTEHLKPFLTSNFSKSVYAWMPHIPMSVVAEEKPNIILHELLERFTFEFLALPPEIENDTLFMSQFNLKEF